MRPTLANIMKLMHSLLCDRCLALTERETETPISEFCARCRHKLACDFPLMLATHFPPEEDPGDFPDPAPEDWE